MASTIAQVQILSTWQNVISSKVISLKFLVYLRKAIYWVYIEVYIEKGIYWERLSHLFLGEVRDRQVFTEPSLCVWLPADGVMFSQLKLGHIFALNYLIFTDKTAHQKWNYVGNWWYAFGDSYGSIPCLPQKQNITENIEALRKGPLHVKGTCFTQFRDILIDLLKVQSWTIF